MDKYLSITKPNVPRVADHKSKKRKWTTEKERIMEIATTPKLGGHDIWQSASTGHQVSEAGGKSVTYNDARLAKLKVQFAPPSSTSCAKSEEPIELFQYSAHDNTYHPTPVPASALSTPKTSTEGSGNKQWAIFGGCTFYLDGYLGPTSSDHTLRRIITQHGGQLSNYLKKTRITHVILSDRGDLAGSKIRKELEGSRNRVKFVKVGWIYRCLEEGRRVGEWRYGVDQLTGGNGCVASMFEKRAKVKDGGTLHDDADCRAVDRVDTDTLANIPHDCHVGNRQLHDEQYLVKASMNILGAEEDERLESLDR